LKSRQEVTDTNWTLEFVLPTDPRSLRELRTSLADWLASQGLSEASTSAIVLATHEAAANAIEHSRSRQAVTVRARIEEHTAWVEVRNEGSWKPATFDDDERGRGLLLITALMSELEIDSDATGTTVRMLHPL